MAVESVLQAHSFRERLRAFWTAFSTTVIGDLFATVLAIAAIALLFLVSAFAVIGLARAAYIASRLLGG